MVRPKNEERRKAICAAATQLFAERGFEATPTAEISRRAGIAEGTLFTYFGTKDELANTVYQELQSELAAALHSDLPRHKKFRRRLRHLWETWVRWGVAHPCEYNAMLQLELSRALTPDVRQARLATPSEFEALIAEAKSRQRIRKNLSHGFIAEVFGSLIAATIREMMMHPESGEQILRAGFKMFCGGALKRCSIG